jgi:hypothetical protein
MKILLLTFLLLQQATPQQAGPRVRGFVNGVTPRQTLTSLEFDLLGGDPVTRRIRVSLAPDGSFDVAGLTPGTYEVYLLGRVVSAFTFAGNDITNLAIAPKPPGAAYRFVRGRVNGTIPTGQLTTSLEFDLLGGDPVTRRTKVNLAPDGSFDVAGLTAGTYEVYLLGRVVSTFQLADRDIAGLSFALR